MKKSLLSVVVCVAVLLSALFVMPASAAAESDFLAMSNMAPSSENSSYTLENGVLTFNAGAAADEFVIYPDAATTFGTAQYVDIVIKSDVKFDLCFNDATNGKWIFGAGDFCWAFEGNKGASEPLPAGEYAVRLDMKGYYDYAKISHTTATLDMIAIIAKEPGKIVVSELVQNDGTRHAPMLTTYWNSPNFAENAAWVKKGMLNSDPTAWGSVDAETTDENGNAVTSSGVIAADGNGIAVSATNGAWPAATYDYSTPFLVDYETTAIEVSYSIWAGMQSNIKLFYGESSNANYDSEEYSSIAPLLSDADQNAGHYVLKFKLSDLVAKESVDENGKVKLNGIKVFAIDNGKKGTAAVTVNAMNLLVVPEKNTDIGGESDLEVNDTTPPSNNNPVVTPNGDNKPSTNNPSTGDSTNAIAFVVVAAAAAGVVTLSIVSKKVKAN